MNEPRNDFKLIGEVVVVGFRVRRKILACVERRFDFARVAHGQCLLLPDVSDQITRVAGGYVGGRRVLARADQLIKRVGIVDSHAHVLQWTEQRRGGHIANLQRQRVFHLRVRVARRVARVAVI